MKHIAYLEWKYADGPVAVYLTPKYCKNQNPPINEIDLFVRKTLKHLIDENHTIVFDMSR